MERQNEEGCEGRVVENTYEYDQDAEYLQHQPAVTRDARIVFEQLSLSAAHVRHDVVGVRINPLNGFSLFCDHVRQLGEDLSELSNRRLN